MPKRDWNKDVQGTDIDFVRKEGDHIICTKDGFVFKCHRSNWPPIRLTPEVCIDPTEFYKYQVRLVHENLYNLDKVIYTKADNTVTVGCRIHGDFNIRAASFKGGKGCPRCSYQAIGDNTRKTTEEFIAKAIEVHGERYDYSLVDYVGANTAVTLICKIHGEFRQTPYNHTTGKGCRACGLENSKLSRVLGIEQVIERFESVHKGRYDYSDVIYKGDAHGLLTIICKEHGAFKQSYANHYHNEQGCPECAKQFSPRLRSGFIRSSRSKSDYASLYLINCFDDYENFFKIGITTKPVSQRFAGKEAMPYYYTVEHLLITDAEWLWDLEKILHTEYKLHKYLPEKEFGGRYECFSGINLDEYVKLLSIIS